MLKDTQRLANQLPSIARAIAEDVYDDLSQVTCSNETRSALALAAGLREVVESGPETITAFLAQNADMVSLCHLIGFADARCRKVFGSALGGNPTITCMLAHGLHIRSISHSRRINGIFRAAIKYAENI